MFKSLTQLGRHRLARQAMAIGGWQIVTRLITFFGSVWAMRCLGPENLGISAVVLAVVGQANVAATLNLDTLFVRRFKQSETVEEKDALVRTVFSSRLLAAAALVSITLPTAVFWNIDPRWLLAIAAGIPLLLLTATQPTWLIMAEERMPLNSFAVALQAAVAGALYFAWFRPGQRAGSDVVVMLVATAASWLFAWRGILKRKWPPLCSWSDLNRWRTLVSEGRWLILTGGVLLYGFLEVPLLSYFAPLAEVGQYRSALVLANVGGQMLAIIPTLLFPRFIEWNRRSPQLLWRRQIALLGYSALPVAIAISGAFLLAPVVFPLVFGPKFAAAAGPFTVLLAAKLVVVPSGFFAWGLWAQGRDSQVLAVLTPVAIANLALNIWLMPHFGMWAAAYINLSSEILIMFGGIWMVFRNRNTQPL